MLFKKIIVLLPLTFILLTITRAQQRIVSLNGTISEMLCALGVEQQIAGVDITSTYPASLQQKTKVGYHRTMSAEGVLALRPTLVLAIKNEIRPEVLEQLRSAKVNVQVLQQAYSTAGTRQLLQEVAKATGTVEKGKQVLSVFDQQMAGLKITPEKKKILFVYARGTGAMTVCGDNSSPASMIQLAGGTNAISGFNDFKPLSPESLVAANPDVIVMLEAGLQSVGGVDGLLKVPGVDATTAGKNKKIVSMDGQLMTGFGLRLPAAIGELHQKISQ